HRGIVQSGGGGNIPAAEQSREFSRQLVKELGVGPRDIGALQKMAWANLYETGNRVAARINGPGGFNPLSGAPGPTAPRVGWGPTLDGRVIDVRAFQDVGPAVSKDVPVIIGNVSEEGMRFSQKPTEAE